MFLKVKISKGTLFSHTGPSASCHLLVGVELSSKQVKPFFCSSSLDMAFQNTSQGVLSSSFEEYQCALVITYLGSLLLGIPLSINTLEHLRVRQ